MSESRLFFPPMALFQQWRYKVLFASIILYTAVACIISCLMLWNMAVTRYPTNEVAGTATSLIPICGLKPEWMHGADNCATIEALRFQDFIAHGWTKVVHRARLASGETVAVKFVNSDGKDIRDCSNSNSAISCHNKAVEKLAREVLLLRDLQHDTLLTIKLYCVKTLLPHPDSCMKHAVVVTEIGEPLTNLKLLQMGWNRRHTIIHDLCRLLDYFENSPLGSLAITDLRRDQFVLVNWHLKLADIDDITVGEPSCSSDRDCDGLNVVIACVANRCRGYNSQLNIQKSFKELSAYIFIEDGVPEVSRPILRELRVLWSSSNASASQLLAKAQSL